jgi:uncharacterized radical SAM superfamily protein
MCHVQYLGIWLLSHLNRLTGNGKQSLRKLTVRIIFIVIIQIKFKNIKLETHIIDIILYNKAELQGCKKFAVIPTSRVHRKLSLWTK